LQVDQGAIEPRTGDRLLLCSDGLTGMIDEERITRILIENPDPQAAADALVEAANEAGGQDNITAVVMDVLEAKGEPVPQGTQAAPQAAPTETGSSRPSGSSSGDRRGGPRRALLWGAIALILVGAGLWAAKALWVDGQFYVGESSGNVALYRGIPAAPLGFRLSTPIEEFGDLSSAEITMFPEYQDLGDGITAESEEDARSIIEQMRTALQATAPEPDPPGGQPSAPAGQP
jgi:protein phosphatase